MYEYLKGIIFICIYILFNYFFGAAILKENKSMPKNILVGYVIFAALLAVVGIPIQLLGLKWEIFAIYLIVTVIAIISYSIFRIRKYNIFKNFNMCILLKNYWFLFMLGIILVFISTVYFEWYWLNNGLDDGYYINRMATLPYINNPFATVPGTGLLVNSSPIDSYIYNIYELEASVYIFLLNMIPTLFARCFLSYINYFIFECVLYVFIEKMIEMTNLKVKKTWVQYLLIILIVFSFSSEQFSQYNLYKLQDIWQNATAMYFGSSIVRSMGLLLLVLPILGKRKLYFKDILIYGIISLVLLSKSSIVLPFTVIVAMSYIIMVAFKNKNTYKLGILFIVCIFVIGIILGDNGEISLVYRQLFISNIKTIIIMISIVLAIFVTYYFRKTKIVEIGIYLILFSMLTLVPFINNIFEKVCLYNFVACRFMTGLFILLIMYSYFGIVLIILAKFFDIFEKLKCVPIIGVGLSIVLGFSSMFFYCDSSVAVLKDSIKIFIENKYFVPQSVISLGEELEGLSKKLGKKLYTLMPEGISVNNKAYALAVSIRQFSPSTVSLSAYNRYPGTIEKEFEDYDGNNQNIYGDFTSLPNEENIAKFKNFLDKYPVNCFISINNLDTYVAEIGFQKYKQIDFQNNYYIYYRVL